MPGEGQLALGIFLGATNMLGMMYYNRNTIYTHTGHPGSKENKQYICVYSYE